MRPNLDTRQRPPGTMNVSANLDEFFIVHAIPTALAPHGDETLFLAQDGSLGDRATAQRFRRLADAEAEVARRNDHDQFRFTVERCSRLAPAGESQSPNLLARIMTIPQPYRRTAYNWLCGRDVKASLSRQSIQVYERHRSMLRDYGIDITQPSRVVLLRRPRRAIRINLGTPPPDAPQQYIPTPAQRRRALGRDDDPETPEES